MLCFTSLRRWYLALLLLAGLGSLTGCAKSGTSLVATVLTDQSLIDGHVIDAVRGTLIQANKPDFSEPLALLSSQAWQVSINKLAGPLQVLVKVTGLKANKEVLSQTVSVTLVPGKQTTTTLKLTAACAATTAPRCLAGETCLDGQCVAVMVGQPDAGVADGPARDGSSSADRSTSEAGTDGGTGSVGDAAQGSVDQGGACVANADCKGGHCADGVCCDTACAGTCMACASLFTGGKDGTCASTKSGMNPRPAQDCKTGTPEECGSDGTCDGAGGCRLYGSTQTCAPAACSGATGAQSYQPASTCDGKGKCAAPPLQSCAAYDCSPTGGCAKPCTGDDACGAGNYCGADSVCKSKQIDGSACTAAKECAHGTCVDGYCCASDCANKACFSCARDYTGQPNGQCQPVFKGKASPRTADCKAADAKTCGFDGTCDGVGACKFFDSSTKCADPSCAGTTFAATATCDGTGKCAPAAKTDCGTFQCSLSGCLKNCQQDTDCNPGSYCSADKTCAAKKTGGTACQAAKECASNFCTDGVCCDSTCSQTCYGCSMAKTGKADGACAPLKAGTSRSATECPAAAMSSCGFDGTCDGAGKCHNWAQGTSCAAGVCSASGFSGPKTCDGAAHCTGPVTVACGVYLCDASNGCAASCSATQPCAGDTYCDPLTAKCASKKSNGQSCTAGGECLTGQCVEGFCCNSGCAGGCSSCARVRNGVADGTCAGIVGGQDPKTAGSCSGNSSAPCAQDGKCDGSGGCRKTPQGTSCGTATCTVSGSVVTYRSGSTCDGSGSCPTSTTGDCKGYVCASSSVCKTSCSVNGDCVAGTHCEGTSCKPDCKSANDCGSNAICDTTSGICKPKLAPGEVCSNGNQCSTGICSTSDRVCCNSDCGGVCESCLSAKTGAAAGICAPLPAGSNADNDCSKEPTECGRSGVCDGARKCAFASFGTSCTGPTSCPTGSNTISVTAAQCDGAGNCSAGTSSSSSACPGQVVCSSDGKTCLSVTCASDTNCIVGFYCDSSSKRCVAKKPPGSPCQGTGNCQQGVCSQDGHCCDVACVGSCLNCSTGSCTVNPSWDNSSHPCGLACFNVDTDPNHCGTCSRQCTAGMVCHNGMCLDPSQV